MKKQIFSMVLCFIPFLGILAQSSVLPPVDFRTVISESDLIYDTPAKTGEEGLPVGNGVMGTLVWTTPSALRFQLNRADVFANDETSHNFAQRHSDYCGGVGFLDIDFPGYDEVFSGNDFRQKLSCYEAVVNTDGKRVKTETFVWSNGNVMAVKVHDHRKDLPVVVRLRTLRPPVVHRGDHSAVSALQAIEASQMTLTQTFNENDYFCKSVMTVTVSGAEAKVWQANDAEMTLTVKPDEDAFYVFVSTAATFDKNFDIEAEALGELVKASSIGYDALLVSHQQWWEKFWKQSLVKLSSNDGIADNIMIHYNYFLTFSQKMLKSSNYQFINGIYFLLFAKWVAQIFLIKTRNKNLTFAYVCTQEK